MRRYPLYLTVAFLSFIIGVVVAINLSQENENIVQQIQERNKVGTITTEDKKTLIIENQIDNQKKTKETTFVCEDELIKPVWNKIMESESFNTYLDVRKYRQIDRVDCAEEFNVELVDINDDGIKEIAIQGKWSRLFCGLNSGCSFWLFKKNKEEYQTILSFGDTFNYKLSDKKHLGFRDVVLSERHSWGFNSYFYHYNGVKYKPKRCFLESFDYYDRNGQLKIGKRLNVSKDDCPKEEN